MTTADDAPAGTAAGGSPVLLDAPLPLLLLEVARDPADGRVRGRSRLAHAVRGACLAELLLAGELEDAGGRPAPAGGAPGGRGTTVGAVAAEVAASPSRPWRHWVRTRALRTFDAATDELVARGTWTPTRTGPLGRSLPRFAGGEERTAALRAQVRGALLGKGDVDSRLAALASMVDAGGALGSVVARPERRRAHERAGELGSALGREVGAAVRDALVVVTTASAAGALVVVGGGASG